jgi:hypothetical protein
MNGLEELLDFVRRNLLQTLFFGVIAVSILRRLVKQAAEDQARRSARGMAPPPVADGDLREQVRRGFEEMMRQRAAAAAARAAPKSPPKGGPGMAPGPTSRSNAPRVAPKVAPKVAPTAPPRVPRVPATAPRMSASMAASTAPAVPAESVHAAAAATAVRAAALAKERLVGRRLTVAQPSVARRLLQDRRSVRRAFLLREILDLPRSLREGS